MDCNPVGTSVHGILQTRTLGWVAIPLSKGCSQPRDQTWVSYISCIGRWFFYLCGTFSLKIPQFCRSGRHCFGKDPQCSPCLLQVINLFFFPIFSWLCLLTRHPQRSEPSFHVDVNPSPWIWLLPVTGREVVAGQWAMEERKQNTWEEEPRNQHLQSTYTVVLMHTKILELLGYRASEEHWSFWRTASGH